MAYTRAHFGCFFLLLWAACSTSTDGVHGGHASEQTSGAASGKTSDGGAGGQPPPASGSTSGAGGSDVGAGVADGLPCDVAAVLEQHCAECHGSALAYGAPFSLVTRADLLSPVPDQNGKSRLEVALTRVQNEASPMPPAPNTRLSASEVATLQSWLDAGTPSSTGSCATASASGDGGVPSAGDLPKPDDCEQTYELKAHGAPDPNDQTKFQIAASPALQGNEYYCFYFDPPYASDQGMYWFQSILDDKASLHHWILYATDNKTHTSGTSAGCNASEPGAYFVAGWAPGATNRAVSPDIALDMPSGPKAGLILEVHYFNNTGAAQQDGSGIRFCTGKKTARPHLAAVHTLGSEGICVQPGASKDVVGSCKPRTDMGDVHITGVWPHMHKIGRNMKVSIKRADGSTDVIHDDPFDFNAQIFYPLTDVVVHPGDSVETTCTYQNDGASQVHYGERTQDEMCYAFIPAWPGGSLTPAGATNTATSFGNRCADQWSILQSCNGAADAPMNVTQP